ncbi:6-phosphofructokinase II [Entomohabitans teleogrylli]|uniref:6-phosphofructokinase II n=1 Tax=Entomohabitans teleogrylli TaxID=1384589 RepID=UPI00073D38CE|nr:6-phosphofructokinase II [Entomohabitans teleogrylli]
MAAIYTLTLAPSLDSATQTPQIYPEGKLRCSAPHFEPGGGGINVARAIVHLGGEATALFPIGGATGEHLLTLLREERVATDPLITSDWTRQNLHVHVSSSGEQYRFVMPGASLSASEYQALAQKALAVPAGSLLVISGSLPPGVSVSQFTSLIEKLIQAGVRCVVDSSGDALSGAVQVGNIELVKPNQKELSALVNRSLSRPDDVRQAAMELVARGAARYVVVSLGPQGALAVDAGQCIQVVPPPMKSQSTVGAGDSMVGAMVLKLSQGASLLDMARYGVAAGSAATLNQGTRLCSAENTAAIYQYLCRQ